MTKPSFTYDKFRVDGEHVKKAAKKLIKTDTREHQKCGYKGLTYNLPINAYLRSIFIFNEKAPPDERSTDLEIAVRVRREYRKYERVMKSWEGIKHEVRVKHYRNLFNKGLLIPHIPELPEKLSFRYDTKGKIICSKIAYRSITTEDEWVHHIRARYSALAKHYFETGVMEEVKRDWFISPFDPEFEKEYVFIKKRAAEAFKRHEQGKLGRRKRK